MPWLWFLGERGRRFQRVVIGGPLGNSQQSHPYSARTRLGESAFFRFPAKKFLPISTREIPKPITRSNVFLT